MNNEDYKTYSLNDLREFFMQMKANRDAAKDFEQANYFYYREMETRREIIKVNAGINNQNLFSPLYFFGIFFITLLLLVFPLQFIPWFSIQIYITSIGLILFISLVFFVCKVAKAKCLSRSFYLLYKCLNGYGNKPLRSLLILLISIISISGLLISLNLIEIEEEITFSRKYVISESDFKDKIEDSEHYNNMEIKQKYVKQKTIKRNNTKLRNNFCFHWLHSSCWLISSSLRFHGVRYKPANECVFILVFLVQYIFTPLMLAMVILSVRRKVKRG